MRDRYLKLAHAQKHLVGLVERLGGRDRIVITKRGQPRAVLVHPDRYTVLEDMLWMVRTANRGAALRKVLERFKNGARVKPRTTNPARGRPRASNARPPLRTPATRRR